ncbi:MAG TPA: hypothetical protein QGF63_07925 [Alphaproteobacteria bacterium]|jgi:hypothetical protein|nr:hypothetical protein [Alphaproteobacteria bacterium]MDP6270144.1 hypothetical protein [Alphaproteobacteria bacterium]MDP7427262.1 hypothetical protein [Alphaproteobacteria bacterium]HJM49764.1 hypothetical protein [Alphaproteobacteria bacterium]
MVADEGQRKLRQRNLALGGVLLALAVLFFVITIVKLQGAAG